MSEAGAIHSGSRTVPVSEDFLEKLIRKPERESRWRDSPLLLAALGALAAIASALVTSLSSYRGQVDLKRVDAQFAAGTELSKARQDTAAKSVSILARLIRGADDRLLIARGFYDRYPKISQSLLDESNSADTDWRTQRDTLGIWYLAYFGGDVSSKIWPEASRSVLRYWDCVEGVYEEYNGKKAPADACRQPGQEATEQLKALEQGIAGAFRTPQR